MARHTDPTLTISAPTTVVLERPLLLGRNHLATGTAWPYTAYLEGTSSSYRGAEIGRG